MGETLSGSDLFGCDGVRAVRHRSSNDHDTFCGLRASNPEDENSPLLHNEHELAEEVFCATCFPERNKAMSEKKNEEEKPVRKPKSDSTSLCERDRAYVQVRRSGGSPRAATRAYCAGNVWATENAKGVGNW